MRKIKGIFIILPIMVISFLIGVKIMEETFGLKDI